MPETLSEFIARRRQEIAVAEEALKEQLRALAAERLRLARAATAITGAKERRQPRGAIKRAVLETLEHAPEGMDALTILFTINYRLGSHFERTSLSPQLSRLKEDGFITLNRKIWKLAATSANEISPAHFKSEGDGCAGLFSAPLKPGEGVVHDNLINPL
jgi:hypothetical protein